MSKLKINVKKYLLISDNSFKSAGYFYSFQNITPIETIKGNWNRFITLMNLIIPNYEGDYISVEPPVSICELIGLTIPKINLEKHKEDLDIALQSLTPESCSEFDSFLMNTFNDSYKELSQKLPVQLILKKINFCIDDKNFHDYVNEYLMPILKQTKQDLIKNDTNDKFYTELIITIIWAQITSWIMDNSKNLLSLDRLAGWYLQHKNNPIYFNIQATSFFVSGDYFDKSKAETFDYSFIEYLLIGYSMKNSKKPIILLSADKLHAEERLKEYLKNYYKISKILRPKLLPGILVIVPSNAEELKTSNDIKIIKIKEIISDKIQSFI